MAPVRRLSMPGQTLDGSSRFRFRIGDGPDLTLGFDAVRSARFTAGSGRLGAFP